MRSVVTPGLPCCHWCDCWRLACRAAAPSSPEAYARRAYLQKVRRGTLARAVPTPAAGGGGDRRVRPHASRVNSRPWLVCGWTRRSARPAARAAGVGSPLGVIASWREAIRRDYQPCLGEWRDRRRFAWRIQPPPSRDPRRHAAKKMRRGTLGRAARLSSSRLGVRSRAGFSRRVVYKKTSPASSSPPKWSSRNSAARPSPTRMQSGV